jgi:CRISPR/Cas system CMR-associated protein Cmr3 (group 5 of RAMP superfamily)
MWGVLLPLAVVGFIAGSTAQAQQTITNTTTYPFFNSLTVCAPINVLISESTDGKYTLTVDADPEVQEALVISYSGGVGIGIETEGDFQSSNPIKITLAMPPGALQYIELDYTNSDVAIDVPFDKLKGEIANNGNGNVIVTRGMDGALAKISTVG